MAKIKQKYKKNGLKGIFGALLLKLKFYFFDIPRAWINKKKYLKLKAKVDKIKAEEALPSYQRGDYRRYSIWRFICRWIGIVLNLPRIIRNHKCRTLVVVHLFYMRSTEEIIEYLKNLKFYKYDLMITYIDGCYEQSSLEKIAKFKPDTKFLKYGNKGFDIGPFIDALNQVDLSDYDIVMKMQSKSTGKMVFIYNQFFKNRDWFRNLWDGVMGSFAVHRTIAKLYKGKKYGLTAAKNLIVHDPEHKQELTKKILEEHGIKCEKDYLFVAGSCFAIRSECLKKVKKAGLTIKDFENTGRGFFSLAHAVERMICFSATPKYKYCGNKVDYWQRIKWGRVERRLRKMSGMKAMKKLEGYNIPADYMWFNVEHSFMKDARIEKMKLGDIKRKHPESEEIIGLDQCEPYLYLLGGKKNKEIYRKYCEYHVKNELPNMSIARFDNLIKSIKKNGYDEKVPIVVNDRDIICDGQHRACVLLYLYGKDYEIPIVRTYPILVDPVRIKPFSRKVPIIDIKDGKNENKYI